MKTAGFWTKDWFLGLAVAIVLAAFAGSDLVQSLERKAYDLGVRATDRTPSDRIAVVAIDDASIQNIGRWPWPRDVHAKVTDMLNAGKAKLVGNLVFFTEPQLDPGLAYARLPPALVAFLDRAMAKEAEARFQTGEEFAQALRASVGTQKQQVDITI